MKYECPLCECELEEQESCSIGSDVGEPCFICKNKECLNYDEVVYDSGEKVGEVGKNIKPTKMKKN